MHWRNSFRNAIIWKMIIKNPLKSNFIFVFKPSLFLWKLSWETKSTKKENRRKGIKKETTNYNNLNTSRAKGAV